MLAKGNYIVTLFSDFLSAIWNNAETIAAIAGVLALLASSSYWLWTWWTDRFLRVEPELFAWITGDPEDDDPDDRHFAIIVNVANVSDRRTTLDRIFVVRRDGKPASARANGSYVLRQSQTFQHIDLPIALDPGDQIKYARELSAAQYDELKLVPALVLVSHSLQARPIRVPLRCG